MLATTKTGSSPAKSALWYGAAIYFNSALLFLSTPVFTRLLSTTEYGEVVLYNSWMAVFNIFATLSLSAGVFNNAMLEFGDDLDAYVSSMMGLSAVCVLVCFALVSAGILISGDFTSLGFPLLSFMFIGFLFNAALLFWQARERFHYRYKLMVGISIPASLIGIVGAIALVKFVSVHRVESRIVAATLPGILIGLVLFVILALKGRTLYSKQYWRYALAFNIPLLPHYLAQAFIMQFDRFAIEHASGTRDVGIYGLAYAVASGVTLFWTAINTSWTPWMLKKLKDRRYDDIAVKAADLSTGVAFICVILGLIAPEVVRLLAPPSYAGAAAVVPVLLFASYIQFLQSFYLNVQFYGKRSVSVMKCSVMAALLNVGLNIVLINLYGFAAAAYVIAASYLFQLFYHYTVVRKRDMVRIVDGKYIAGLSLLTAAMIALSLLLPAQREVRWAMAVLAGLGLLWFALSRIRAFRLRGVAA